MESVNIAVENVLVAVAIGYDGLMLTYRIPYLIYSIAYCYIKTTKY